MHAHAGVREDLRPLQGMQSQPRVRTEARMGQARASSGVHGPTSRVP